MELPTLKSNKTFSGIEILQSTVLVCVILYFGKTLFIPLSFATLLSFILYPICKWLEQKGINKSISIFLSLFAITLLLCALLYLIYLQIKSFSSEWYSLQAKLLESSEEFNLFLTEQFGLSLEKQLSVLQNFIDNSSSQFFPVLRNIAYSISETLFFLVMILVFTALILFYRRMLSNVLYQFFPSVNKNTIYEILTESIQVFYNFFKGMFFVYLIVGILNSIGLAIIGVPHPILFGFLASILTFIPYFGIMIAAVLPITVSWIEYNSIWYPLGVILVFGIVQILESNIIFPIVVGNRLKINPLVILVMIIAGGILWGAAGMILFIPFISIVKLIADRIEKLKILSLLLSDDGNDKKGT